MRGSSVAQHRIPRVYACYLLRSLSKPNQTYVGSTPDPVRRLRQHNGLVKNGAFYTRMARPWTMDVVVYGFPSKLAALQFEWSWQSPHLSRHLRVCDRPGGSIATYAGRSAEPLFPATRRTSKSRSGHTRVRQRSTSEPEHKFVVLRALLASEPFCCWDLHVALHSEYAFGLWRYMERAHPDRYRWSRITRRPLPAAYPSLSCDFRGVLGDREPLAYDEHAAWPPLPEAGARSVTQKRAGAKGAVKEYLWDELTPPARDAETMGLSWDEWRAAPTGSALPVQLDDAAHLHHHILWCMPRKH
ncbi:Slx4p interacting protein [Malassezia arunalokei]|uniref:Slx4p interacting protein n=1 Tax=Malassezia arunalokei TaxID=1514897 RepID=A0AAJ5Z0U4_9BASI|nr:Slx4p interacting protein [Malassezia arunalokei]